ncbi:MAG: glycosyltransferase family 39 protein, partial [Victivallales bacterium]|nr:glycosyltransferase family 39 protein [Victivallales bacterium]
MNNLKSASAQDERGKTSSFFRQPLFLALSFALACRLALAFIAAADQSVFVDPDSNDYIKLADHLAAGVGYTKGDEPEIFRAPGYPFLLSFFRRLFPDDFIPMVLFQALLSVGTIFLLWRLALLLGGDDRRLANFAVMFQCLTLTSIVFSNKILSETLFTFLLTASLLMLETSLKRLECSSAESDETGNPLLPAILAGCALSAALMTRAILLPLIPLFAVYISVRIVFADNDRAKACGRAAGEDSDETEIRWRVSLKSRLAKAALPTLLFLLPVVVAYGAWSFRNLKTADFAGFSSVARINIYRYYACLLLAKNNGRSFDEQQGICTAELEAQGPQAKQAEYAVRKGLPVILREPLRYFFLHLKTDVSSLLPDVGDLYRLLGFEIGRSGTLSVIRSRGILAGVKHYFDGKWGLFAAALPLMVLLIAKFAAAAFGTLAAFKSKQRVVLLFFAVVI